jgi:hypothetical protein
MITIRNNKKRSLLFLGIFVFGFGGGGAWLGFQLGGLVGAVIGGIVGAIVGFFSWLSDLV